ncbi:MAG: hypothetical protein HUU35_15885, partial [Armatimonadetes bacterium]|nr:hypothetical protein [Armatimonadota bacterium]
MATMLLLLSLVGGDAGDPWGRGRCRELFISGLPQEPADLQAWAAAGVTSLAGAKPEAARPHGLLTRGWFTLNYMDSRSNTEAWIKERAAVRQDGTYLRPFDPLFPTVGQYGWTACVNNPLWVEHARGVFTNHAKAGHTGAHVDFASHYEPCFCQHCQGKWAATAAPLGLPTELAVASGSDDLPTRLTLREFRIRCVMDFLADLRGTARAIEPRFGVDGTWHRDSGSTYQWAYGDHFDLMCIEGTTHGPFPPEGTQIPWLKLSHALSRRGDHRPAALSVTYHLLTDENGAMHHGRMAPDRLRVALAELVSQGAASWLGLGGPKTGNLLKEHLETVKAYYRLAADLEPLLASSEDAGEVGLLFSPRSYLVAAGVSKQMELFAHTLLKAHRPFQMISDVGLTAAALAGLRGVVLLEAAALSDEAIAALTGYVDGGGKLLVMGDSAASLDSRWRPRESRPSWAQPPAGEGALRQQAIGAGQARYWLQSAFAPQTAGAAQLVTLNQSQPVTLAIEGWSKAEGVSGATDGNYSLYVDLIHQDGSPLWGQTAPFRPGTHDWQFGRKIITVDKPVKTANVHLLFRGRGGTAWFKDVRFGIWDEARQEIVENLLTSEYQLPDGKVVKAPGGADGPARWGAYGNNGYDLENQLDLGLWVRTSGTKGLEVSAMTQPAAETEAAVLQALEGILPGAVPVRLSGAGADRVSVEMQRSGDHLLLHLINHQAALHPERSEAEQQQRDQAVTARDLLLTVCPEGLRLDPAGTRVLLPEGKAGAAVAASGAGVEVRLPRLDHYAVVV